MTKGESMRRSLRLALSVGLVLGVAGTARADVWDVQTQNDNSTATENELVHGSDQLHDLGALPGPVADQDWFRLSQKSYSSYEVVADATSGDIGATLNLARIAADGSTVVQSSGAIGVGYSRSLRWANTTAAVVNDQYVRVTSGSCTTNCGPDDVYRVRFSETTYAVPRFNNSGTQITVLLLQNPAGYAIGGNVYLWDGAGTLVGTSPFTLAARQLTVLNTGTVAPGVGGTLTIAHDGRYGDLAGKTVALEPATGFSFDSPMVPRLH
jgi:hypothetical protein